MRTSTTLSLVLALVLALCACSSDEHDPLFDPQAPGANGIITLAPGVMTTGYNMIALRMTPMGDGTERISDGLLPGTWPLAFQLGGGIGASHVSDWTVRAWLATAANETEPAANAPHDEVAIDTDCAPSGSCNVVFDLMLELAP